MRVNELGRHEWLPHVAGVLAVSVVVFSLAIEAFRFEKERHVERAQVATRSIATLIEQNVSGLLDKADLALQAGRLLYRQSVEDRRTDMVGLEESVLNLRLVAPDVGGIHITDADGLVRVGRKSLPFDAARLTEQDFFRQAREQSSDRLIVVGPRYVERTRQWVMVLARRLMDDQGAFAGVIFAEVDTQSFEKHLASAALGRHGAATIRTAGMALVHRVPDTKNAVGSTNISRELQEAIAAHPDEGSYVAPTALDGIERSNAYRKAGNYPFYVLVGVATDDYLGNWTQNILVIVGLASLTIVLSVSAGYRGYRAQRRLAADLRERQRLNEQLSASLDERRRLNDELAIRARQAEAASVAKSAFLSNMSHEMRTPLNHIQGMAHLVQREPLSAKQSERLDALITACRHLASLLETILELTKIEADTLELVESPLEIADIVTPAVAGIRASAIAKGLAVVVGEVPAIGGLVGDKIHLQRALANYLSNAVRFTETGSVALTVSVMSDDPAAALVRFEVADTGPGIAAEDAARLFSIFEQVDNSSTRQFGGLGVGLAMTRKLARALGGDAGYAPRPEGGSLFWFSVSLRKRGPALPPA